MATFLSVLIIIGKVLLVVLLVLLALLLLVLFVPFRYEATGDAVEGNLAARAKVTWLLHILTFTIDFSKPKGEEKKIEKKLWIFGICPVDFKRKRVEKQKEKLKSKKKKKLMTLKERDPEEFQRLKEEARQRKEQREEERRRQKEEEEAARKAEEEAIRKEEDRRRRMILLARKQIHLFEKVLRGGVYGIWKAFWCLIDGIRFVSFLPIRVTTWIFKIVSKIAGICDTIAKWKGFIDDPRVRNALRLLKKRGFKVIKHIFPRHLQGELRFGFEDASLTGELLAAVSVFYPLYAGKIVINPDFSEEVLEGHLKVSGRVRIWTVGIQALLLWLNRDVRYTIKYFKSLRNESDEDPYADPAMDFDMDENETETSDMKEAS